jgi:hypothetical protein
MVTIKPKELIGRTFLKDSEEDGQSFQARVVGAIVDKEHELKHNPEYFKFVVKYPTQQLTRYLPIMKSLTTLRRNRMRKRMTQNSFGLPDTRVHSVQPITIGKVQHTMYWLNGRLWRQRTHL